MIKHKSNRKNTLKYVVALPVILALSACGSSDDNSDDPDTTISQIDTTEIQTVAVTLDSAQEIPAPVGVPSDATGTADVSVDGSGVVTATLRVSNLTGTATMAHIHRGIAAVSYTHLTLPTICSV